MNQHDDAPSDIVEYRDSGCVFCYNRTKEVLHIQGSPKTARKTVLKLRKEGWLSQNLRAIWFSGNPALLLVGINLTLYLAAAPLKTPKRNTRTFKDIVTTPSAS